LAQALFRRYADGLQIRVSSYGTEDVGGVSALPIAIEAAVPLGVDLTSHRAGAVRHADLGSADLVVGFEPSHVANAVVEGGAPAGRTFLLGELVPLLDATVGATDDPYERARTRLDDADMRRVRSHRGRDAQIIADPLGKSAEVMERTAAEIDDLVRRLVSGLFDRGDEGSQEVGKKKPWWRRR